VTSAGTSSGSEVRVEIDGAIATIRLDRPPMNALSRAVQESLREAARDLGGRAEVRAVVLYGGPKVFAAGADIKEMAGMTAADMAFAAIRLQECFREVARIPKPVIAAVTGYALGGGLELALCADIRIFGETARVGQPEIQLGIIPGAGGTQRLPRLIGPSKAKDLIFTGRHVRADEALALGIADQVVPADEVYDTAVAYAQKFAAGPAVALAAAKRSIDDGLGLSLDDGLRLESTFFAGLFGTEDRTIGMTSFQEEGPGKARFVGR
jgi:enoyl-CoA hydratase/carnithine racemase